MKHKSFVKLTALTTAAVMAVSPSIVFAEDSADDATTAGSTINGSGELEDYITKDVFKVVLPTNGDANFKLDPQGLLKVADSTKYEIGAGAIYFGNKQDDGSYNYSNTSDPIEIINKSSYDIDVDFSVKVTLPEGVKMVDSADALANATTPSIYLAMKEESGTATALSSGDNIAATKKVNGVDEDTTNTTKANATGYIITATGDATNGYTYKYELGDKFDLDAADKASYILTGSCDTTADWTTLKNKNVTTEIIWSAERHVDQVSAHGSWSGGSLWISKDESTGFSTTGLIVEISEGGTTYTTLTSNQYSVSDAGWVSITYDNMVAVFGSDPTGMIYIRITDGTTKYVYENR